LERISRDFLKFVKKSENVLYEASNNVNMVLLKIYSYPKRFYIPFQKKKKIVNSYPKRFYIPFQNIKASICTLEMFILMECDIGVNSYKIGKC